MSATGSAAAGIDPEDDVGEHGPEPSPAVDRDRGRPRRRPPQHRVPVQPEVEDRVHHAGHADLGPGAHRISSGLPCRPANDLPGAASSRDTAAPIAALSPRAGPPVVLVDGARRGLDHERGRHRQPARSSGPGPPPCRRTGRSPAGRRRYVVHQPCRPAAATGFGPFACATSRGRPSSVRMSSWNSNQMLWIESAVGLKTYSDFLPRPAPWHVRTGPGTAVARHPAADASSALICRSTSRSSLSSRPRRRPLPGADPGQELGVECLEPLVPVGEERVLPLGGVPPAYSVSTAACRLRSACTARPRPPPGRRR